MEKVGVAQIKGVKTSVGGDKRGVGFEIAK